MTATYMQKTVKNFYDKIDSIEQKLQNFSLGIDKKRDLTITVLDDFKKNSEALRLKLEGTNKNGSAAVQQAAAETIAFTRKSILNWEENIKRNAKGQQFMHKNEKYLVAMIFGQVKVGKSSLGNFIAGKYFIDAPFDNEYKNREHPSFCNEIEGRDGNITRDESNRDWFTEGLIDTTGAIQYFTLSGLRWIDSPGTGAVKKEGDTLEMNGLVNEYIGYTDMGIFLMNSSEPGLQTDMAYIQKMKELGKDTLVIITRSDISKRVKIDGIWKRELQAKSEERRTLQEETITNEIDNTYGMGEKYKTDNFKVISVSTSLAAKAIAEQNDELFKESHLDMFMNILSDKCSADSISLKEKNPKRNLNNFIDSIINGSHSRIANDKDYIGIVEIENKLNETLKKADEFKKDIERRSMHITQTVCSKASQAVGMAAADWDNEVRKTGKEIPASELSKRISLITGEILKNKLGDEISDIIADFQIGQIHQIEVQLNEGLKKEQEVIKHKYKEHVLEPRDPDGLVEHIRDFFGHTYYTISVREREKETTVDLGTNVNKFLDDSINAITDKVRKAAQNELNLIADNYFKPQVDYALQLQKQLTNLKERLLQLKFEE